MTSRRAAACAAVVVSVAMLVGTAATIYYVLGPKMTNVNGSLFGSSSGGGGTSSGSSSSGGVKPGEATKSVAAFVTFYGAKDNCPPGANIAFGKDARGTTTAGGLGTYSNPVTCAAATAVLAPGVKLYVPRLKKYFIMEDDCEECRKDWAASKTLHFDLWIGPQEVVPGSALIACEIGLAQEVQETVVLNPAANLPVELTPLFNGVTDECIVPAEVCIDEENVCGNTCIIDTAASCAHLASLFGLTASRFAQLNPKVDCTANVAAQTSVCMGGTCGD